MKNIKDWNEFQRVNELRTETYSKLMQKTDNYPVPMTSFDPETAKRGKKMGSVNRLANDRFETEFNREFPPGKTTITFNGKDFQFRAIRFENNYGTYYLMFDQVGEKFPGGLYVHRHRSNADDSYFVEYGPEKYYSEDGRTGLDARSEDLVLDMLKYNKHQIG